MRGITKEIRIEGIEKPIVLKELRVKEIMGIIEDVKNQTEEVNQLYSLNQEFLAVSIPAVDAENIIKIEVKALDESSYIVEKNNIKLAEGIEEKSYTVTISHAKSLVKIIESYCKQFTGLTFQEYEDFYPSEIEMIIDQFQEANGPLLRTLALVGMTKDKLKDIIKGEMQERISTITA